MISRLRRIVVSMQAISIACTLWGCSLEQPRIPPRPSLSRLSMPAFAPDSSAIAFISVGAALSPAAASGLLVTNFSDGSRALIASDGLFPAWAPDSKTLAFSAPELTLVNVATGFITTLTAFETYTPTWSPNGDSLAFATFHQDPRGSRAIWTIASDGNGPADISTHGTGEWIQPAWNPRGPSIAHVRYTPGSVSSQIYVMLSDGSGTRRLTFSSDSDFDPQWSPDSSTIAFVRQGSRDTIWLMDANGSNARFLTDGSDPSWLPSGAGIIYRPPLEVTPPAFWIINTDGSGRRSFQP